MKSQSKESKCVKYFGVLLDKNQNLYNHIKFMVIKLSAANGVIGKLRKYLPQKLLLSVDYDFAYSYLQYTITFWGNASLSYT